MPARLSAFVLWALVAASVAFWSLRLSARPAPVPLHAVVVGSEAGAQGDLTRLLGAPPAAAAPVALQPDLASRFRLSGVLAPKPPSVTGLALISVDGKPPRAYMVGARLDGELTLQSVARRSATIGPANGPAVAVLELPPPAPAATGTLPSVMPPPVPEAPQPAAMPPAPTAEPQTPIPVPGQVPAGTPPAPAPAGARPGTVR